MKQGLVALALLGVSAVVWGAEEAPPPPDSPEATIREIVSRDDLRFFLDEARQAVRAASRGESYVPDPETATRARVIGERMRAKGAGLMEWLLDQVEEELSRIYPAEPDEGAKPPPKPSEPART